MVEENLKTLRSTHRTLMILFISVLLVTLYPYRYDDYSDAIEELDAIHSIDLEKFIEDSYAKLAELPEDADEITEFTKSCLFSIKYELNKIGISVDASRSQHVDIAAFDVKQIRQLQASPIIEEYRRIIAEDFGTDIVWFRPSYIAEKILSVFKDPKKLPRDFWNAPAEGSLIINSPVHCPTGTKNFSGVVTFLLSFTKPDIGMFRADIENPPVWFVEKLPESGIQFWLREQMLLDNLVKEPINKSTSYKNYSIFPDLQYVWSLVYDKTPKEAKRILLESRRKVSLLGMQVDIKMIILVGPIVTSIIYLYFLCLLSHFKSICNETDKILHDFPWLLLFPGKCYTIMSCLSCFVPSLVLFGLIVRYKHIGGLSLIIGFVFALFSLVLAWCCFTEIKILREKNANQM